MGYHSTMDDHIEHSRENPDSDCLKCRSNGWPNKTWQQQQREKERTTIKKTLQIDNLTPEQEAEQIKKLQKKSLKSWRGDE